MHSFSISLSSFAAMPSTTNEEKEYMLKVPYASAIGSMMYVMVCTIPDIVSVSSRYMTNHATLADG